MPTRLMLFIYSNRNIAGSVCALLVLALFFGGIIHAWWLPLTIAAYLFGWLILPPSRPPILEQLPQMPIDQAIDAICADFGPRLPAEPRARLGHIQALIHELAPRFANPAFPATAGIELANTVSRDLPATIGNYLALPASFAKMHTLRDGKTAQTLLTEQLVLLHNELTEMAADLYSEDADKLISHGEYLKQKFQPYQFIDH